MTITPVVIEDSSPRDLLNRQLFVEQLLSITDTLSKTRKNACYAITGDWGSGKSFVLDAWLQNGYKNFKDAIKSSEYVDFVDELRIFSAVFHQKSRSSSRVGMIPA